MGGRVGQGGWATRPAQAAPGLVRHQGGWLVGITPPPAPPSTQTRHILHKHTHKYLPYCTSTVLYRPCPALHIQPIPTHPITYLCTHWSTLARREPISAPPSAQTRPPPRPQHKHSTHHVIKSHTHHTVYVVETRPRRTSGCTGSSGRCRSACWRPTCRAGRRRRR